MTKLSSLRSLSTDNLRLIVSIDKLTFRNSFRRPRCYLTFAAVIYMVACTAGGLGFFYAGGAFGKGDTERGGPPASGVTANAGRWVSGQWQSYGRGGDPKGQDGSSTAGKENTNGTPRGGVGAENL